MNKISYFPRTDPIHHLQTLTKANQVVGVFGRKGVGKSSLVRNWLQGLGAAKVKWISLHAGISLLEKIGGSSDMSLEEGLEKFSETWRKYDWIIWEDIHLLPKNYQLTLVQFAKNSFSSPNQIVISDEDLPEIQKEIATFICQPLTKEETRKFIDEFLVLNVAYDLEKAWSLTGGLPILLLVWSQNQQNLHPSALTALISDQDMTNLAFLSFMKNLKAAEYPEFENLHRRYFVDVGNGLYTLQSFISEWIPQAYFAKARQAAAVRALSLLRATDTSHFELAMIAIAGDLKEEFLVEIDNILPFQLENLSQATLSSFLQMLSEVLIVDRLTDAIARMQRLFMKASLVLGNRTEAMKRMRGIFYIFLEKTEFSEELLCLAQELIYLFNRSAAEPELVQKLLVSIQNRVQGRLKFLVQIEQAIVHTIQEPERAIKALLRVLEDCKRFNKDDLMSIQGHAALQAAICYGNLNQQKSAKEYNELAEQFYERAHETYMSVVCRLNCLFLAVQEEEFPRAHALIPDLKETATRYGYPYVLSGVLLAEANLLILKMNFPEALQSLDEALSKITQGAPPRATSDILLVKVEVLIRLGRYADACKIYDEHPRLHSNTPIRAIAENHSVEEISDCFAKAKIYPRTFLNFVQLMIQNDRIDGNQLFRGRTPQKQWLDLEMQLRQCQPGDRDSQVRIAMGMRLLIKPLSDQLLEKVALDLLELQLLAPEHQVEREEGLNHVQAKLEVLPIDPQSKLPFELLIQCLRANTPLRDFAGHDRLRELDRQRWAPWLIAGAEAKPRPGFLLQTMIERQEITEYSETIYQHFDLAMVDHLGQVYFFEKEIEEFHRKSILRQMLSMILEVYPHQLNKAQLAQGVWGESYSPLIHDSRIYTSVQRLRMLLQPKKSKLLAIESWEGGYRWNPQNSFVLIKPLYTPPEGQAKIQALILRALQSRGWSKGNGGEALADARWLSRADLAEITQSSDSTVKRELAKLLAHGRIERKGNGPTTTYALKVG